MLEGSEFQTVGAATLKPREAKVVRTRGTDNRLVFDSEKLTGVLNFSKNHTGLLLCP